jgi:hypothetical protein
MVLEPPSLVARPVDWKKPRVLMYHMGSPHRGKAKSLRWLSQ